MKDTFGRADGDVLTRAERAAVNGRRITARRARRQKHARDSGRGWSIGSLTVTPVVALVVALVVVATVAGAAVALGGGHATHKAALSATPLHRAPTSTKPSAPVAPAVKGIYIRYVDTTNGAHFMYCTKSAGCGLLEVAKDGTSKISVSSLVGVAPREAHGAST